MRPGAPVGAPASQTSAFWHAGPDVERHLQPKGVETLRTAGVSARRLLATPLGVSSTRCRRRRPRGQLPLMPAGRRSLL